MTWLGAQPDTIFIGQTVLAGGSYMSAVLDGVPVEKRIEWPVAEEMQLGASLGLALEGYCVVSIYPRIDFLLLAVNQLVNHLDKIGVMSEGKMRPRIIIRTSYAPLWPLNAGPQHTQRHLPALRRMLTTVRCVELLGEVGVDGCYRAAYERGGVWLFIEDGQLI